jgi:acetyltransferase-like isoleucine patch superfamily enzyme
MSWMENAMLKIRRGEGPVYSRIRDAIKAMLYANLPQPGFVKRFYRGLYAAHRTVHSGFRWLLCVLYREPALRARCATAGQHWHVWLTPLITGHPEIHIGDHLSVFGELGIASGRIFDHPKVIIGNGVDIGHRVQIVANKEVVIEDHVNIASRVYISDTDGHPRDAELRSQRLPPPPEEIRPVRICSRAWLGQNCFIMKGVTIGEGAIIGANSVVITDVPPYSVAIGNPARVVVKDVRPQTVVQVEPTPVSKA